MNLFMKYLIVTLLFFDFLQLERPRWPVVYRFYCVDNRSLFLSPLVLVYLCMYSHPGPVSNLVSIPRFGFSHLILFTHFIASLPKSFTVIIWRDPYLLTNTIRVSRPPAQDEGERYVCERYEFLSVNLQARRRIIGQVYTNLRIVSNRVKSRDGCRHFS